MIEITHERGVNGWTFRSSPPGMTGGGRTLDASKDAAVHAARQHLGRLHGRPVRLEDAARQLTHVVAGDEPARGG
jgi:hypothetical protein